MSKLQQDHSLLSPHMVFDHFPTEMDLYQKPVQEIMEQVIIEHGLDEWKSSVLTHEIHGHIGIYSLIGVKMGCLAKELLHAMPGCIQVESWAGNEPPVSCFNDGLQVSTGATLGKGLIKVVNPAATQIKAVFQTDNQKITLKLKSNYQEKIDHILVQQEKHHLCDRARSYWKDIEDFSFICWKNWDRKTIFSIE